MLIVVMGPLQFLRPFCGSHTRLCLVYSVKPNKVSFAHSLDWIESSGYTFSI